MHAAKQLAKREETLRHAINHKAALEALIQLVTVRNLSYNCSSWPELHALISAVNPAADDLISLSHGSIQQLVSNSFRVHKDMLRRKLQSTPWKLHLSADVWSAPNHKAFLGICVKFVDPDAKEALQALLALSELPGLDGPGSHGGAEQWKLLQHVLEDYNIWNKVGFYTGDNHGSNDKLCRLLANYLQEKGVDWEAKTRRIRCHGHIVNLAVQAFLFIDSKEAARAALEHIEDTDESAFGTDFSEGSNHKGRKDGGGLGLLERCTTYRFTCAKTTIDGMNSRSALEDRWGSTTIHGGTHGFSCWTPLSIFRAMLSGTRRSITRICEMTTSRLMSGVL
ncbi:hypothetical protein FOFC_02928 [Fusarium oxysporum]|nr:hypothetical protein FocnCong_v012654 [Fusarium oxysporum f. sp. conglutinans]KAI8416615.1 hypothetical protein FOFC_02928 [Fusarium oxysporum]